MVTLQKVGLSESNLIVYIFPQLLIDAFQSEQTIFDLFRIF